MWTVRVDPLNVAVAVPLAPDPLSSWSRARNVVPARAATRAGIARARTRRDGMISRRMRVSLRVLGSGCACTYAGGVTRDDRSLVRVEADDRVGVPAHCPGVRACDRGLGSEALETVGQDTAFACGRHELDLLPDVEAAGIEVDAAGPPLKLASYTLPSSQVSSK